MSGVLDGLEFYPVTLPMRYRFRGVDQRDAVIIRGSDGWAEFSPFTEYPPEIASVWLAAALESARGSWPTPIRMTIPINVTVPAVDARTAFDIVVASGCRTAKVKVAEPGVSPQEDEERLAAVREAIGAEGKIRIDANGAWDLETAVERLVALDKYDLEYAEQPVRTLEEMVELRKRVEVKIAADESLRMAVDPLAVAERHAADILVLKVQPLGGVGRALEIAKRSGLPCVVSSALETSVGISAGLALAAALPSLDFACGLGTVSLLAGDVVSKPLLPIDGQIEVRRPVPDSTLLRKFSAEPAEAEEMIRRLRFAAKVLE
jgi:O-succinylbenzoate synthase